MIKNNENIRADFMYTHIVTRRSRRLSYVENTHKWSNNVIKYNKIGYTSGNKLNNVRL